MYQGFDAIAVPVPWQKNPYQPISWLEMLEFSAQKFFWCGRALRGLMADCLIGSVPGEPGERGFFVSREIDDEIRNDAVTTLKGIEAEIHFDKVIEKVRQAGIPQERERLALMVSRSRRVRGDLPKSRSRKA